MAIVDNLLDLEIEDMVGSLRGQKIYVYGSNDTGKTKQTTKLGGKAFLMMTENGGNAVRCYKKPLNSWAKFTHYVKQLTSEKMVDDPENKGEKVCTYELMQRKFSTVVIDTVEDLVGLAEGAVKKEFGVRTLGEIDGKSNGYLIARDSFRTQINLLCSYGYTVVFLGHEEQVTKIDEITGEKYIYIQPKGTDNEKGSTRFVRDLCDFCFYLKDNTKVNTADGINNIMIYTNGEDEALSTAICKKTRHVFARSRYAIQSFINPFTAKNMEEAILKAIEKSAQEEGSEISSWNIKHDDYSKDEWIALIQPYFKAIHKKYPEKVKEVVAVELGEGAKVSQATEEQCTELENIYNTLVAFACNQGIVVEE